MDRVIVYPEAIPLETDLLSTNQNVMIALGWALQTILGTSTLVTGLACTQTTVPSLSVSVAPGAIYSLENLEATAYSSLPADLTDSIVKQGISQEAVTLSCPAPTTAGNSVVYLIEAAYQDVDSNATVLPYYNASEPAVAYSGPNGTGVAQYTVRKGVCAITAKAGVSATTGSQVAPAVDTGYTALFTVTVAHGQTTITSANIAQVSGAPLITETLTQKISQTAADARYLLLSQLVTAISDPTFSDNSSKPASTSWMRGFSAGRLLNVQVFTASGTYMPTAGTTKIVVEVLGGGGGGGGTQAAGSGQAAGASGANAGTYGCGLITSGFSGAAVTVGAGGTAGAIGGGNGGPGGTSSFGAFISAPGGSGGLGGAPASGGYVVAPAANTAVASGGSIINEGGGGGGPYYFVSASYGISGFGGSSRLGAGPSGTPITGPGNTASNYGCGGSGALSGPSQAGQAGGAGAPGVVIIWEYA